MDDRADALRSAARLVLAVADAARAEPGAVGTVGDVRLVSPASNIVPGAATVLVDLRAPDDGALARVRAAVEAAVPVAAAAEGCSGSVELRYQEASVRFDERVRRRRRAGRRSDDRRRRRRA